MSSTTILPPRFEDREAEQGAFPVIPVYEEVSGSLRPTWIPVDPTTFVPPPPKKSRAKTFALVSMLALLTWGVGFAAVVGGHEVTQRYDRRSAAAAAAGPISEPSPVVTIPPAAQPTTPTKVAAASGSISTSKPTGGLGESGFMLTIDVNDLPVIKNKRRGSKSPASARGRVAGS